ncbi:MAG: thiamine phosphate synthase, partial [Erythrobacter sp.]|nr:thiamine phosphate synthase [Erythrobacter sp.]
MTTQLYLISPLEVGGDFPQRLERALEAGVREEGNLIAAFQFRVKDVDQHEAARLAEPLQAICAKYDCAFIVNDSVPLTKRIKADGVHLGQDDGDPREAREDLGRDIQIGVVAGITAHAICHGCNAAAVVRKVATDRCRGQSATIGHAA